jgi:hypothetical protein
MGKHERTTHGNTHKETWENNTGKPIEGFDRLVVLDLRHPFEHVRLALVGQYLGL